jgi:predicted CoA-substrate-specific enzyme activase
MNDKCAAGTGRFLEVMAQKLEVSLEAFAALAVGAGSAVPISSMCSVFAESEVISLIAEGKPKDGIARGVHEAIAARTASLCKRIAGEPPYSMAGGVAKNGALVRALSACLGAEVAVLPDPQFSGALGAALLACRSAR